MFTLVRISWRNMWRNVRRTGIIMVSVIIGVWGMTASIGYSNGFLDSMIDMAIGGSLGHLQVHAQGFEANPSLQLNIDDPQEVMKKLERVPGIVRTTERIKTVGMLATARKNTGAMIVAIDPDKEREITRIAQSIKEGEYLKKDDRRGILLGSKLAEKLNLAIGDKVVLQMQGYDGTVQAVGLRVLGKVQTGMDTIDKLMAYITLPAAQETLGLEGKVSEIVVMGADQYNLGPLKSAISAALRDDHAEVLTWGEIMPELQLYLSLMDVFNYIFLIIIYFAMAFGIANTMIMAIFERIRELGILKALGTSPGQVFLLITIESVMLCMSGVLIGLALSWGTVAYFHAAGLNHASLAESLSALGAAAIIYPRLTLANMVMAAVLALIMAVLASLYPAYKAARLRPVEAIRFV